MTIHIGQNFASGVIALVLMIGYFYAASIWNARATHKQNWLMVILFDLICHVAFDQPPLTRRERANNVKKRNYFTKYGEQAQQVLGALLDKYADEGVENIESLEVLNVKPFTDFGSRIEIVKGIFGGKEKYQEAVKELERELYQTA